MNYFKKVSTVVAIFSLVLVPSMSFAQNMDGSSDSTSTVRQYVNNWRRGSSDLQQKINLLGSIVEQNVYIPVLFGVELNNISPNFGDPRSNGRTHAGEDIMATKGIPIVSPTAAVVLRTGVGPSEGNYVYTANPGGETFVYMHLDKIGEGVVSGTVLARGDLVGYIGNTGNASGGAAHLHFEIHDNNGTPVNPFPRLTATFTTAEKSIFLAKILMQTGDATALNNLINGIQNISTPVVQVNTNSGIARNLYQGLKGEDVRTLQRFLNSRGYTVSVSGAGSLGNETTYFGPATASAVIKFQLANNISPAVGYVGSITRGILNKMGV